MLEDDEAITSSHLVKEKVKQNYDIKLGNKAVTDLFKKEFDLTYKNVRKQPVQVNTQRCLVLRQQYALEMIT